MLWILSDILEQSFLSLTVAPPDAYGSPRETTRSLSPDPPALHLAFQSYLPLQPGDYPSPSWPVTCDGLFLQVSVPSPFKGIRARCPHHILWQAVPQTSNMLGQENIFFFLFSLSQHSVGVDASWLWYSVRRRKKLPSLQLYVTTVVEISRGFVYLPSLSSIYTLRVYIPLLSVHGIKK